MKKTFVTLFGTEAVLSLRGGDMPFFGILFPVGVMILTGLISTPEATRLGFGGIAAIGICAAGIMGLPLTFSGYRHAGILKRFRVTPVSPVLLLTAVAGVQAVFALISGAAVFLIARLFFGLDIAGSPVRYALTFAFVLFSVFSIGFLIASLAPNVKTANVVCTIVYFPMLILSGATVPFEILPRALQAFAGIFPLTQGIALLKGAVTGSDPAGTAAQFAVLGAVAIVSYAISFITFKWE